MAVHDSPRDAPGPRSAAARIEAVFAWLGGGQWCEVGEAHERSTYAITGVVVALDAALAWLAATLAVGQAVSWPPAILPMTLAFGLLAGALTRAIASGPARGVTGIAGRAAVAVGLGAVVGELAVLVVFSGAIDRRLEAQAARTADVTPAVALASTALEQSRNARSALDNAVERAREHRDQALVVARCEYHPTPACPQTRITGVPGAGPETQTANAILADAQRELDTAVASRDSRAPELDAQIARAEQALARARETVIAAADHGLGARWVAMNDLTLASAGTLLLRLLTIGFCALLYLLPLILRLWRGETTADRRAAARAERDRAELDAATAIAVKRAEVRRETETLWAEKQLAAVRAAVAADGEINRVQQRRRVAEALGDPALVSSQREAQPDDVRAAIAAEAQATSPTATRLPAAEPEPVAGKNLPAALADAVEPRWRRGTPVIPDVTKAAARWVRPLIPSFVARAVDTATQPVRAARQVLEEVEEITFSLKRTRKVTVNTEAPPSASTSTDTREPLNPIPSHRRSDFARHGGPGAGTGRSSLGCPPAQDAGVSLETADGRRPELIGSGEPRELPAPEGPRQLPPAE
ncbi:DUF4407 domain-containing protein [Mycobacterium sp. SM1]|uniref:DUF4407 domain-containing protein n=1 Tax=Mycobacterium sp. SM1 TaxID=2816243 RepID=UPI001BCACBE0|nr:DUF4407 domain-containing protein [Mycobacterium sp. SM1]MBS4729726.1 DUF4407 domain-containing protein [Mycobacterium sp. SM1]